MADDLLRLPTIRATSTEDLPDGSYLVHAQIPKAVAVCRHCGSYQSCGHGVQKQRLVDVPHHGRPTVLALSRRRCRRMSCRQTYFEAVPEIDDSNPEVERMKRKQAAAFRFCSKARLSRCPHVGRHVG